MKYVDILKTKAWIDISNDQVLPRKNKQDAVVLRLRDASQAVALEDGTLMHRTPTYPAAPGRISWSATGEGFPRDTRVQAKLTLFTDGSVNCAAWDEITALARPAPLSVAECYLDEKQYKAFQAAEREARRGHAEDALGYLAPMARSPHARPEQETEFSRKLDRQLQEIREVLLAKNKAYGNSVQEPVRVFSKADNKEQIRVRIDDKLSRICNTTVDGDEDTVLDLIGYLLILRMD